jgi:putative ABC transport system permease protein
MSPVLRLALNSLSGRRGRTGLIVGAVALASSLIVAVACAMHSAQATIEQNLARTLGAADARVVHLFNGTIDESLLDDIRAWPEVALAVGRLDSWLTLIHADERVDPETGRLVRASIRALGIDPEHDRSLQGVTIQSGRDILAADEIILDPMSAERLRAGVGDELVVQRFGEPVPLRVVGLFERETIGVLQRPQLHIRLETLAEASGRQGTLSGIWITLRRGVEVEAFCAAHAGELADSLSLEPAERARTGFDRRMSALRMGLVVASALGFMCASFIIVTGMTTAVVERQRELGLWRCLGASRRQVFASQLWIGLLIGAAGAAVGTPIGIALAAWLVWHFRELLPAGFVISPLGVGLSAAGALLAGLLGAAYPAWRAARVPPLRAMASAANPAHAKGMSLITIAGLICLGAFLLTRGLGDEQQRFWTWMYFGLPIVHIAFFLLAAPILMLTSPITAFAATAMLRLPRSLLIQSIRATPIRHGLTAGALMVGMAVFVGTWSNGTALLSNWLGKIRFADGFAFRSVGISPQQQQAIAELPFVKEVCPIGYLPVRVVGQQVFGVKEFAPQSVIAVGFDPEVFFRINSIHWVEGDPDSAIAKLKSGEGVIVAKEFNLVRGMKVGDRLRLGAGRVEREFEIVGVVEAAGLELAIQFWGVRSQYTDAAIRCVFLDWETVGREFDNRDAYMMQVNLSEDLPDTQVRRAILDAAPGVGYRSGRFIRRVFTNLATAVLSVYSTIALAALALASLGVANIVAAGIHSRQFEFGVLRAVGGARSLLLRLILGEALVVAIAAGLAGTLLGMTFAFVNTRLYRDLIGLPLELVIPWKQVGIGLAATIAVTLLAALPAAIRLMRAHPRALLAAGRGG